jgi:hypothetical protein
MAFIVEMAGGRPDTPQFRHFSCGAAAWDQVLEVARHQGWQPLGTSPDPVWKAQWERYGRFSGDYRCDEYGKVISTDDAAALANALERAIVKPLPAARRGPVLIREGMTAEQFQSANTQFGTGFLKEFIAFLRNGEFSFFWDD